MRNVIRFRDLQAGGIVGNRVQLNHLINKQGFPRGFLIGPNSRGWFEADVETWLKTRPTGKAAPRGFVKDPSKRRVRP